ncbi:nucleotidyltransferase family protein [Maridesulfovibrio frigidus]|uniref:nucleotidyltransferase family protein n=1 Tax=Maridesulfovibrio frigidus TaxID=340956 RepID=UPI0004E1078E|nr:nucleotidyltransferase family protein [Maridesulfovibrio frigidus]
MLFKLVLTEKTTFEDALKAVGEYGYGFVPVVNSENHLLGIIADGDIRRAVLEGKRDINSIINKNPYTLSEGISRNMAVQTLRKITRRQAPIVDSEGKLVDVITLDELDYNAKPNVAVIMAGGLGTRLGDLTKTTPKPMLPIGNKPVLEYIIESLFKHGFTNLMISVNYKSEIIKDYFKDGSDFGVQIEYIEETKRLGTAGSLGLISRKLEHPFLVMNGDILTNLNFGHLLDHHVNNNAELTVCSRQFSYQLQYGIIEQEEGKVVGFKEKPSMNFQISAGIYTLSPGIIDLIPEDVFYDMTTAISDACEKGLHVSTFPLDGYWIDIGQKQDYHNAINEYAEK